MTGLSEEDRALLDRGKVFDTADRDVQSWKDAAASVRASAAGLLSTVDSYIAQVDSPPADPEAEILRTAHAEYQSLLNDAKTSLDALMRRAELISGRGNPGSPWTQWAERLAAFKVSYEAAVQRSSAHSEKMKQLRVIEEQLDKHVRETSCVRDELRSLTAAEASYKTERDAWEALLKERDDLLDAQCQRLTQSSGGAIRASMERHTDSADFVSGLRQSLSGSRVQGAKIEALGESIGAASDKAVQWNAILGDLEKVAEFDADKDSTERRPEMPVLAAAGLPASDLDRIAKSLKPEA